MSTMKRRLISTLILIAYILLLIKVMVYKDLPTIRVGQLMLNFAGTDAGHAPNLVPFATILPYLFGYKGWIIAGINLVGNIFLLVPIGLLLPLVYPAVTWKKSLAITIVSGLIIELTQALLMVGIFDIDDVILNALGVMIGYFSYIFSVKWIKEKKYLNLLAAVTIFLFIAASAFYVIYPHGEPLINPRGDVYNQKEQVVPQSGDLCGGTGGTGGIGEILTIGNNEFVIERKDGSEQKVNLAAEATIKTLAGSATLADLKSGNRVTLVGGPNSDGTFTADTVVVCGV